MLFGVVSVVIGLALNSTDHRCSNKSTNLVTKLICHVNILIKRDLQKEKFSLKRLSAHKKTKNKKKFQNRKSKVGEKLISKIKGIGIIKYCSLITFNINDRKQS